MSQKCPLCSGSGNLFHQWKDRIFYRCTNCSGVFVTPDQYPHSDGEKERYLEHNNDVEDVRFQNFVSPITNSIQHDYKPEHAGLDFGSGTGSAVSKVLTDHSYNIKQYDPFFANDKSLLDTQYDYIACCEVIEHFHDPAKEFSLLKSLLKPNGALYCMTDLDVHNTNFDIWYYKNDYTHVFFYCPETIEWIKEEFGFKQVFIEKKLIIFYNYQL